MVRSKIVGSVLGGALALALLGGGMVAYAQTNPATPPAPSTETEELAPAVPSTGSRSSMWIDGDQALADALGIEPTALTAAQEEARSAIIDQLVADGVLTAEQGESLKSSGGSLRGISRHGYDRDEFLAGALGISVETLEAAQLEVYETELAARVAAGDLTQAEADLKLAQKAAEDYIDTDAINAQVRAAQEAAIAAALADGAITQEQADALLAYLDANPYQFNGFNGRGGHGGRDGGRGHGGGRGFDSLELTPAVPETDTTTTTGSGA